MGAVVLDSGVKPEQWGFDPSLVAPEWAWFHDQSFLSGGPLWEGGGNPYDYGDRQFATLIGAAEWKPGVVGPSLELNDASRNGDTIELTNFDATQLDGLKTFTYALHFTFTGSGSTAEDTLGFQWTALQGASATNARRILIRYDSNNNEIDFFHRLVASVEGLTVSANLEDGKQHTLVCRYDSPGADKSTWLDGIKLGSTASQTGDLSSASHSKVPEVFGGNLVTGGTTDSPRVLGYVWAFHNRAWTDTEIRQWSRDPFGPFRMRVPMPFFVPAAAGGVANPWYAYAQQ